MKKISIMAFIIMLFVSCGGGGSSVAGSGSGSSGTGAVPSGSFSGQVDPVQSQ
jgi:hypothetical protein